MIGILKTKQHNIDLINQILSLNIPQIRTAVRRAIRKYNIIDGNAERPTASDLLCIVFECLSEYLETLNLQQVQTDNQYLIEKINQIGDILQIVNVANYLQCDDIKLNISKVISPKVSNIMVSLSSTGVYDQAEKVFRNHDRHLYSKMLDVIKNVTEITHKTSENSLPQKRLTFWYQDVFPLMFDKNQEIQSKAITAIETVIPLFRLSSYQDHPDWHALELRIVNQYADEVIDLREKGDSNWYKIWNILINMLNKKLLRGSQVINKFLAICEQGFKSSNFTVRAETYLCWKVLLEIYAQDPKYLVSKRIKLLLVPFKPAARTAEIAINKFLVWWSLICKVNCKIEQHYEMVLIPFLWSCFSLSDMPILSLDEDGNRREEYPQLRRMSTFALINFLGPINDATESLFGSSDIERIDQPLVLPNLLENAGKHLINSCGEVTWFLKDIELVDAISISDNLWSNLMNRMADNKNSILSELILQNLTILTNASQNDEPAKKLMTHVVTTVLSSKNLIPANGLTYDVMRRISNLLCSNVIQLNDDALDRIITNFFATLIDSIHMQPILQLIQSQTYCSNANVGLKIWLKTVNHILNSPTIKNTEQCSSWLYGYVGWPIKYSTSTQLPIFLPKWNKLICCLKDNDSNNMFWNHINVILREAVTQTDTKIYTLINVVFELINPIDTLFPEEFKSLIEFVIQSAPSTHIKELQTIKNEINNFSQKIIGKHSLAVFESLNELVKVMETKFPNSSGQFGKFRQNYAKVLKASGLTPAKPTEKMTSKDADFVFIPSTWQFRPENLTERQKEKMKEKRSDIPALYNDTSQSQDSHSVSLKPWTPKQLVTSNTKVEPVIQKVDLPDNTLNESTKPEEQSKALENSINNPNKKDDATRNVNTTEGIKTIDAEERKRKRMKHELNKLTLAINNADEFTAAGRTRRMSVCSPEPTVILRTRCSSVSAKGVGGRRGRPKKIKSDSIADNSIQLKNDSSTIDVVNDSSDIIEASQPIQSTPTIKTRRTSRIINLTLSSKKEMAKDQSAKNSSCTGELVKVCDLIKSNELVSDKEIDKPLDKADDKTQIVPMDTDANTQLITRDESAIEEVKDVSMDTEANTEVTVESAIEQVKVVSMSTVANKESITCETDIELIDTVSNPSQNDIETSVSSSENISVATVIDTVPNTVAIPEENTVHKNAPLEPIESKLSTIEVNQAVNEQNHDDVIPSADNVDVVVEVDKNVEKSDENSTEMQLDLPTDDARISTLSDECTRSPVLKPLDESHSENGILASPSDKRNESKTTELLNATVDISPILHSKASSHHSKSHLICYENIVPNDQPIKRTDLDNLIKPPMDSPILLQPQKMIISTPQSHKEQKILSRKFQLQGRGAQLLQLANIRKIEGSPSLKAKPLDMSAHGTAAAAVSESVTPNAKSLPTYEDILASNKDLFRFSKELPSATASPSNSIMKRSIHEVVDVNDDCESPHQKRKRVSFHDPPVSATKEFIRFAEEVNPNRGQINRNNNSPLHMKNFLKRKSRVDSFNEIDKHSSTPNGNISELSDTSASNMKSLKWISTIDDDVLSTITIEDKTCDKEAILQQVIQEYPIEDLLNKYLEAGTSTKVLAKEVSKLLTNNEVVRKDVLEELSEKYPNEFLDVTLQENLRKTVFDRLSPSNLLNYIADRAKIDDNVKIQLMEKFASIIGNDATEIQSAMKEELYKILLQILSHKLTEQQLLHCLDIIFEKRRTNSCS